MVDRTAYLANAALPNPPAMEVATYHRDALSNSVEKMLRAQDNTLTPGYRVALEEGWKGAPISQAEDISIDNGDTGFPSFTSTQERKVAEVQRFELTPGHILRLDARALYSGRTRDIVVGDSPQEVLLTGSEGIVRLKATWTDGVDTETVISEVVFEAPETDYGHGSDFQGSGFIELKSESAFNRPPATIFSNAAVTKWSQSGITVDLELIYVGAVRPVDVVIYEVPFRYGRDEGLPAGPAHIFQEQGVVIDDYPPEYAIAGPSPSGDARLGATYTTAVGTASQEQTGPAMVRFSSQTGARRPGILGPQGVQVTSTTLAPVDGMEAEQTFDASAGSFGRRFELSDPDFVGTAGVVRCRVSVLAQVDNGGTATVRVKTEDWSYVELQVTAAVYEWVHATFDFDVRRFALDGAQFDLSALVSVGSTAEIRSIVVQSIPR